MNGKEKDIWSFIRSLKMKVYAGKTSGDADKAYCQLLEEGLAEKDIDKIYQYIEAVEQGCGLSIKKEIREVIKLAYEKDVKQLCTEITKRKNLFDYWWLLSYCNCDMIIDFVKQKDTDPLFLYECARQLLKNAGSNETYRDAIIIAVCSFAKADSAFWSRWIKINELKKDWLQITGIVLAKLDREQLEIYAKNISLEKTGRNGLLDVITVSYQSLSDDELNYILKNIADIVCKRWLKYLEKSKEKQAHKHEIVITIYTNLIIYCMFWKIQNDKQWIRELEYWVDIMEEDLYKWYKSFSNMQSVFFWNITSIYYLLIGINGNIDKKNETVKKCLKKINNILTRYEEFWRYDEKGFRKELFEYCCV